MTGLDARAKDVFAEALDLSGEERTAYLERICAGDGELRGRVERLLAGAEAPDEFLNGAPAAANLTQAIQVEQPGTWIGQYQLMELVGEGGFGSVFLAQQDKPVQRRVALKVIKLGMDTRAVVARFEQERQALAVMDHPNIAKVLDAGATSTGRPYFVMEYVRGLPITRYCDQRRLSLRERIELFTQVCGAVQHAHSRGIIHRDLKPSNILVAEVDGKPAVKVIDFGIAKAMDRPLTNTTIYTEQRALIGTPEYMSPEQADGSLDLDTRTDVYSLGVVLYELLAGAPPIEGRQLHQVARAEMERIIREVEPARPSTRVSQARTAESVAAQRSTEPARLTTQLRGELDWIVMRALEKDRLRRYESASALAADLGRYLAGEAVVAAPPSRVYLTRKFVRRHRGPVIAATLLVAALAAGTIGTGVGLVRAKDAEGVAAVEAKAAKENESRAVQAERPATAEAENARRAAAAADSVNELMTGMVKRADRGREGGNADITVREVMDAAARTLLADPGQYEPEVRAKLAETIASTYRELSLFDAAEPLFLLAEQTRREVEGPASLAYAAVLSNTGALYRQMGKVDLAGERLAQAAAIARDAGGEGAELYVRVLNNQATLARTAGRLDEAQSLLAQARGLVHQQGLRNSGVHATTLQNIAAIHFAKGELDQAEATFRECIELRAALGDQDPLESLTTLRNFGAIQMRRGRLDEAAVTLGEEVALTREFYGESMKLAESLKNLAIVNSARGNADEAIRLQREAMDIASRLLEADSAEMGFMHADLGAVLFAAQRWEEAEGPVRTAAGTLLATVGAGHIETVMSHYRLGSILVARGAHDEATGVLTRVLDAQGEAMSEGARYEWMRYAVRSVLGEARLGAGDLAQARELIPAAAENLMRLSANMGVKTRASVLKAALDRCVTLLERLESSEPGSHAQDLAHWRARRDEFLQVK